MTLERRDVERALGRKGFTKIRDTKHSHFLYVTRDGLKSSVRTMISHGKKGADIGDSLVARMARQCRINKKEFENLVDCSLSREDYENLLIAKAIVSRDTED